MYYIFIYNFRNKWKTGHWCMCKILVLVSTTCSIWSVKSAWVTNHPYVKHPATKCHMVKTPQDEWCKIWSWRATVHNDYESLSAQNEPRKNYFKLTPVIKLLVMQGPLTSESSPKSLAEKLSIITSCSQVLSFLCSSKGWFRVIATDWSETFPWLPNTTHFQHERENTPRIFYLYYA